MLFKKTIPDSVKGLWRKVSRFELARILGAAEKSMEYFKKSLAYIDRVETRTSK